MCVLALKSAPYREIPGSMRGPSEYPWTLGHRPPSVDKATQSIDERGISRLSAPETQEKNMKAGGILNSKDDKYLDWPRLKEMRQ